jgi:hypothetical protein
LPRTEPLRLRHLVDDRSDELCQQRMVAEEERLPEPIRDPSGKRAGNQQAANDVDPDRGPIHNEIVVDGAGFGDGVDGPRYGIAVPR